MRLLSRNDLLQAHCSTLARQTYLMIGMVLMLLSLFDFPSSTGTWCGWCFVVQSSSCNVVRSLELRLNSWRFPSRTGVQVWSEQSAV